MVAADTADTADAAVALRALRQARRRNHREVVHWADALYKVYVTALGSAIFVVVASGWLGDTKVAPDVESRIGVEGAAWLGLAFAVALAFGLRSGARGGPLALEAPAVQYELQAPIDRGVALRAPAEKQLRFLAFAGAVTGACIGVLAARRLTVSPVELVVCCALAFALGGLLAGAGAMVVSGRRIGIAVANAVALLVVAWSAVDAWASTETSPLTWLGSIAFWPLHVQPLAVVSVLLVAGATALAVTGLGGTSIESARRRAGLVSQLRFAVTLQDIRTVVLIRRQLAQEMPRGRPWIRLRGRGRMPESWRRDWQSYLRFPGARVARVLFLAALAGLALGFTWRGAPAAFLGAALALFLVSYEASEPIAQEVDHPSRWASLGGDYGSVLLRHLWASGAFMFLVCVIAAACSLVLVPASVVLSVAGVVIVPVAVAATVAGALATVLGGATTSAVFEMDAMQQAGGGMDLQGVGLDANTMGFVQVLRLVLPPGIVVAALAPVLRAGSDAGALNTPAISNGMTPALVLIVGTVLWLRYRRPARI